MRRLIAGPVAAAALALAACGSTTIPQVASQTPLTAGTIAIRQTGDAPVLIDQSSVSFTLDTSGSLVVRARIRSQASGKVVVVVRASLFDARGNQIGDATGGQLDVPPGTETALQLNGPTPHGTIAGATFEATTYPVPGG